MWVLFHSKYINIFAGCVCDTRMNYFNKNIFWFYCRFSIYDEKKNGLFSGICWKVSFRYQNHSSKIGLWNIKKLNTWHWDSRFTLIILFTIISLSLGENTHMYVCICYHNTFAACGYRNKATHPKITFCEIFFFCSERSNQRRANYEKCQGFPPIMFD